MRRLLLPAFALAAASCARDLEMPSSSPPRIDSVHVVGLEASAPPAPLPVLGGELVAIRGGGFPADAAQLQVQIGGVDAEVKQIAADRLVVRVPSLAATGPADLRVSSPVGFRTVAGAIRYDGSGQPAGFGSSDVHTSVALGFVAPVQPPSSTGFPDLAVAIGAADSALVVVPSVGAAVTTVPLGLVPSSAAARFVVDGTDLRIQVLALARGGEAALGTAVISTAASVVSRVAARPLPTSVATKACTTPQITFTNTGASGSIPVAAWVSGVTGEQKIAAIDMAAADSPSGAQYKPAVTPHTVAGEIVGWAPWQFTSVVFAANLDAGGSEIYVYDAATPAVAPTPLTVDVGGTGNVRSVSSLVADCSPMTSAYTVTAATSGVFPDLSSALAVAYRDGGGDEVALVDLTPGPSAGTVHRGLAGTFPTSLALVPDPPFGAPPAWSLLAAGLSTLYRFRPVANPDACADLVPDAALSLSSTLGILPTFGGMITAADGTRLLAATPDQDVITVLPPSLTSAGPVFRLASYGGVTVQPATIGGGSIPIAVAEHASTDGSLSSLDTGSALLVLSLAGDGGSVALGGSGYGRGAVWVDAAPGAGALAYTGQLPSSGTATFQRAGAAAVTGIVAGACPGEDVRITGSRPVANGSDLVVQGPARSGALGPDGIRRYGPATPPIYAAKDTTLDVYVPGASNLACLAGATPDWDATKCPPDATVDLGVSPLDVTLSAGDATAAVRTLDTSDSFASCTQAAGFPAPVSCVADLLCLRASCPPAKLLWLARAGSAPSAVALPDRPTGVAADRAGGFLVTLPCAATTDVGGGAACFPAEPAICDGFLTGPGGADGALLLVSEDGSRKECLAVQPGLAGPVAVTPNGEEAWVTGPAFGAQILTRLALLRRTTDGTVDASAPAKRLSAESLGSAAKVTGAFPPGGVAFTPDGATGIVTVPGEFRILLFQ
jgi:hypothetical protein